MNFPEETCRQLGINSDLGIKIGITGRRINCLTKKEVLAFRQKMLEVFGFQFICLLARPILIPRSLLIPSCLHVSSGKFIGSFYPLVKISTALKGEIVNF